MRIGINGLFQANGGSLTHLRALLTHAADSDEWRNHELVLFANPDTLVKLREVLPEGAKVVSCLAAGNGLISRLAYEQTRFPRELLRERIDLCYCPANTMPLRSHVPCVVSFQNAAPFCEHAQSVVSRWQRWKWKMLGNVMLRGARQAQRVICISNHFRSLLKQRVDLPEDKVSVLYRARPESPVESKSNSLQKFKIENKPYLLCVSHVYPYKNLLELVEGYRQFVRTGEETPPLVIAGRDDFFPRYSRRLKAVCDDPDVRNRIVLTGGVSRSDVVSLLAGCHAFAFPSTCENCPTTLIEAMSFHKPIACSNLGVMPEITGDSATMFDPYRPNEIAAALQLVVNNDRERLKRACATAARVKKFPTEQESAAKLLKILESAVGSEQRTAAA